MSWVRLAATGLLAALGVAACTVGPQERVQAAGLVCDVAAEGAVADDGLADTNAIQAAIDACKGQGGMVVLGPGVWDTGQLKLGSRMEFHLSEGAVLRLIPDIALFPQLDSTIDPARPRTMRPGLAALDATELTISGMGRIEGNGPAFWDPDFYTSGLKRPTLPRPMPAIGFTACNAVIVRDIALHNLPGYAISFRACDGIRVEAVSIRNDPRSPNTDGIQLRDTSNAVITGVDIRTGDDAVVLKTHHRIMRNIRVEDSYLQSDDGALKFGTGSRAGVQDSVFRDLTIADSRYGIAIFMIDGGRHANNRFEDISIRTGGRHARTYPIFMDIDRREADRALGEIEGFVFQDIDIETTGASMMAGNPDAPIRNLTLRDVRVTAIPGLEDLSGTSGKPRGNIHIEDQSGSVDHSQREAHFVIAHAKGVRVEGLRIETTDTLSQRVGVLLIDAETASQSDISFRLGDGRNGVAIDHEQWTRADARRRVGE